MSRLFGFMCNDPERLACALYPARDTLVAGPAPDGWGLAFFQGGEVLLQRHPKAMAKLDFFEAVRELRTDYLIGQVRDAGAVSKLENTPPFRFRSWVYAQSGTLPGFAALQAGLLEHVPDFLRRNIRGQTDAEHVFHVFLSFLHDEGKLDDPSIRANDVAGGVRATVALLDRLAAAAGTEPAPLTFTLTNGRILLAARRGKAMWMRRGTSVLDCQVCRQAPEGRGDRDRRRVTHEHLRSVLLVSEPQKIGPEGWEEVADATIVSVSRDLTVSTLPLKAE